MDKLHMGDLTLEFVLLNNVAQSLLYNGMSANEARFSPPPLPQARFLPTIEKLSDH